MISHLNVLDDLLLVFPPALIHTLAVCSSLIFLYSIVGYLNDSNDES